MKKNEKNKEDEKENWRGNLHVVRFCVKIGGEPAPRTILKTSHKNLIL